MSHTNSTPNYNLPQFVGTDKPTWLNDVNGAMSAIDTQMKANADSATQANTNATTAVNNTGTLANLNTTDKTSLVGAVNEINTGLGVVSGVASQASTTATNSLDIATALSNYFNLTQIGTVTSTIANGSFDWQQFAQAVNAEGSLGKIYGSARFKHTSSTNNVTLTIPTAFRPEEPIDINGVAWYQDSESQFGTYGSLTPATMTINTNGNITITTTTPYNQYCRLYITACMIFAKNFGDTPTPEQNN